MNSFFFQDEKVRDKRGKGSRKRSYMERGCNGDMASGGFSLWGE